MYLTYNNSCALTTKLGHVSTNLSRDNCRCYSTQLTGILGYLSSVSCRYLYFFVERHWGLLRERLYRKLNFKSIFKTPSLVCCPRDVSCILPSRMAPAPYLWPPHSAVSSHRMHPSKQLNGVFPSSDLHWPSCGMALCVAASSSQYLETINTFIFHKPFLNSLETNSILW